MAYEKMVLTPKEARARKRLREGDVGADYRDGKVVRNWGRVGESDGDAAGGAADGEEEEEDKRRTKRVTRSMVRGTE